MENTNGGNGNSMKEYNVFLKFSDVIITVEANSEDEARDIAETRLENDNLKEETYCYEIEAEEIEDDE